jgi:hypothetical protein
MSDVDEAQPTRLSVPMAAIFEPDGEICHMPRKKRTYFIPKNWQCAAPLPKAIETNNEVVVPS